MRKYIIFAAAIFLVVGTSFAVDVLIEPFDDASQFTITSGSGVFYSDGFGDYLGLHGVADSWGAGTTPSAVKAYTGFDIVTGSILTGMDLDGDAEPAPAVLEWTGLNITGLSGLQFSGDFAEFFDTPGDIDDAADMILVEYQIDGGGYQDLLAFEGGNFSNDPFNGFFMEDTDFNGVGDGTQLGDAAQTFSKLIPGTGTTLDIRLTVSVDAGDEDFAIDNFEIVDGVPVELQSFSIE